MYCTKCGKPNDDDAQFCEFCGAEFKRHAANPAPQPSPQQPAPAPKKRRKGGVIAAVIVIFVLNKRSAPKDAPSPTGSPTMTVNGKNIPVNLAVMGSDDEYTMIKIAGKADNELFGVMIGFSETLPQSGTKINSSEDYSLDELNIGNNSISDFSVLDGIKIDMLTV